MEKTKFQKEKICGGEREKKTNRGGWIVCYMSCVRDKQEKRKKKMWECEFTGCEKSIMK